MSDKSGIYQIKNLIDNKIYIGSAVDISARWSQHRYYLNRNKHQNKYLQRVWNKYGSENFKFIIVEKINDLTKLIEREQCWLDWFKSYDFNIGYNLAKIAGSQLGYKHTDETRKLLSEKLKNRKLSEETKQKMTGRKHTEKTKEKIRISSKNRKITEETRLKMSLSRIGTKQSSETLAKLSMIRKGKNRKIDKWPHELGSKCKCDECKITRNEIDKKYKHNKNKTRGFENEMAQQRNTRPN